MRDDRRALQPRRGGVTRLLEQSDRVLAVACLTEPIRPGEDASLKRLDILGRCEPDCELGEFGSCSGSAASVHTLGRVLDDGCDLAARVIAREGEMPRSLLGVRSDVGEAR